MGILNLKNKTAHKFIKNQSKKTKNREKIKVDIIKSVGIIAKADLFKAYDFTNKLNQELGLPKNAIKVVLFDHSSSENSVENYYIFSEKSFGLYGKIKEDKLKDFVNTRFDLLINYCDSDNVYAQISSIRSKAKLKAGFDHDYSNFNDITIKIIGNKIDTFNNELIKYLQILNLLNNK